MKKIAVIFLLLLCFTTGKAQEIPKKGSKTSFIEWNLGIAFVNFSKDVKYFPGTSVLWGKTFVNKNDFVFEFEAGLSFPTIVTGKIGIGKKYGNIRVVFGVRPFPFNLYLQSSNRSWMVSAEYNPLDYKAILSFRSKFIINFGYRWNL